MPELPEVETIVRGLRDRVIDKKIINTELRYDKLFRDCSGKILDQESRDKFIKAIENKRITDLRRRGKYILFQLEDINIIVHLRMTGKFSSDEDVLNDKHTHLVFWFEDGTFLLYNDIRKFGTFQTALCSEDILKTSMSKLGPEPLGEDFTLEYLTAELKNTKKNIKAFLLTQEKIAGIGNIYADEVLFFAKVCPKRLGNQLSDEEIKSIHQGVIEKLRMGIEAGGASIRNYVNESGEKGNFQNLIKVYGKKGEKCQECETTFITETVAGRTSTWCPTCQK
jgi:formamidopyrimidine-DNA glycosylase